jgi:Tfp pilus assembly protein PilV
MARWRTGALLPELMLALVVLATGLAPAAWLLVRSERLVARARARERVAQAGLALLAEAPALACRAVAGARDDGEVTLRWTASGDTLRSVVAHVAHRGHGVADTLVTTVACP